MCPIPQQKPCAHENDLAKLLPRVAIIAQPEALVCGGLYDVGRIHQVHGRNMLDSGNRLWVMKLYYFMLATIIMLLVLLFSYFQDLNFKIASNSQNIILASPQIAEILMIHSPFPSPNIVRRQSRGYVASSLYSR